LIRPSAVIAAALLVTLSAGRGQAQEVALNIQSGLWQMTSQPHMSGAVPDVDRSRLTAAQLAKLEAAIGKPMAPRLYKECLTRDKFIHGMERGLPASCQRTLLANTPRELELRNICTDGGATRTLTVHMQSANPQSLTGSVVIEAKGTDNTLTIDNTLEGHFLSADCGTVQDVQPMN
jgi:hypothetical protein